MSRPNSSTLTIILAGGQGERLSIFSEKRAKPAVPFAGKYRIIDFALSNCVNSGLTDILVLTQYRPSSLHDHIGIGRPWDLDRLHGGVRMVSPYLGRKDADWYRGTSDAVYQNLSELANWKGDTVLILGGDHIYKMDYRPMINMHLEKDADVTVGVMHIPIEEAHRFGIVTSNEEGRIVDFQEKPKQPKSNQVSMGIYVFKKDALVDRLLEDARDPHSQHDFGHNIIPKMLDDGDRAFAYPFLDYWRDVGTVQSYWEANMELLTDPPAVDLYERKWIIYTKSEERPSAIIGSEAKVERSMVSHGCQIYGQVIHSVLSPGVIVEEGAVVKDSIIMFDTVVGKNSVIDHMVIDKEVIIGPDSQLGVGDDFDTPNKLEPGRLNTGLSIIGKRAHLPAGLKVGRNVKIGTDLRPTDFPGLEIATGETVQVTQPDLRELVHRLEHASE
ncbi:MAG: glucose-1-phosphate adenylyltransferase [Chloroflexi bacterium]|nr:glucose-1-phosphate adenylyltransferase [Chloroflexota bacterium]OJV94144.1 MAG: glucose-1-phosphate adenylyltransferase [Chloroflexi bacterium 54-19]